MRSITYDINDLYHYIDLLPDLSALVLAPGANPSVGCAMLWGACCSPTAVSHLS
jgi:hypothetical protein